MSAFLFEQQILERLTAIPELALSGFSARAGLTGAGVALLKGRTYYGAWRMTAGALVWTYASISGTPYFAPSVDDAVRHTMMMVLRSLETTRTLRQQPVMAMAR